MEKWVPLFDIFLNSPIPETPASLWLSPTQFTTSSFLSLLSKPIPTSTVSLMFIQTLPNMLQSRILSFLAFQHQRFSKRDLTNLARNILTDARALDFWVQAAARNLLDQLSDSTFNWISGFNMDSGDDTVGDEEFQSLPAWIEDKASDADCELVFPWLPASLDELNSRGLFESERDFLSQVGEFEGDNLVRSADKVEIDCPPNSSLVQEIQDTAATLRGRIANFESGSVLAVLAGEVRQLCLDKGGGDSFAILGLLEPWKADDEIASVLMSNLVNENDHKELTWPSQVLSSIILPKMLILEEPASRVLVAATIDYCKVHQRAAEYALLFPLILRVGGINNFLCDVVTRVVRECLHPVHVSSFCQKLLCGGEEGKRFICLPCHQCLISNELVWTESLFNFFHNILNHNVQLTQDSVDQLVLRIHECAQRFSKSLRFGNFFLCFITKCSLSLACHKLLLNEAVEQTNMLVTKSILSKLATF